jgi:hypothetical protein
MAAVQWIVLLSTAYAAAGLLFGIVFVFRGVQAIDPAANGSGVAFRLIILPGCAALWPVLLVRWFKESK